MDACGAGGDAVWRWGRDQALPCWFCTPTSRAHLSAVASLVPRTCLPALAVPFTHTPPALFLPRPLSPSPQDTVQAMLNIGLSESDRNNVWRLTACVLHIGNVDFVEQDAGDGATGAVVSQETVLSMRKAAELLDVSPAM